ncbi:MULTISPECIES: hypothetical protein [Kingella]|uniref:Uncharacterized protein n=2 Tax=Kingella TaxID=32257 RepID=A0ABS1BUJ3_9NEIS|nr:hypothetical protein [Kingella bonacorsii]MBK0396922.1 hypothetical protein [Kingella bonacorsii]
MFTHPINNPQHWRLANILATHAILFPSNALFFKFQAAYWYSHSQPKDFAKPK